MIGRLADSRFVMVRIALALVASSIACSPSAASITSSLIDDFSGPSSAANGFTRSQYGGAAVSGGAGVLPLGGGFAFVAEPPNDAHIFNGISLEVGGNLGQGTLFLSLVGADNQYFAVDVPLNDYVHDGSVWITFNQIDAEFGNEPSTIAAGLSAGIGIRLIELDFLATEFGGGGPLTIDNLEFRAAALPAPGAAALLGLAGLLGGRRRR
jgi:hypothetical protein